MERPKINEIRLSILSLLEREAGVRVEDGCWVYEEASGAKVKVSRPGEVLAAFRNYDGSSLMLILKSIDLWESGEAGLVLCLSRDEKGGWHKTHLSKKKNQVVLPIGDSDLSPVWFTMRLDSEYNGTRYGDWHLVCPERDWTDSNRLKYQLDFYRKVGKMLDRLSLSNKK